MGKFELPIRSPTLNQALHRWPGILATFGLSQRELSGKQGPCPLCGGDTRFTFTNIDGTGSWICTRCGSGYGIQLVQKLLKIDFVHAIREVEKIAGTVPSRMDRPQAKPMPLRKLKEIWDNGLALSDGSVVLPYLASRGIVLPEMHNIREVREGMLALVRDTNGRGCQLHRTIITGGKMAARLFMPGKLPPGSAVRLQSHSHVLGIAEGIETALSATMLFNVPCWAALNAGQLEKWEPPPDVTHVTVFGDNDRFDSWAGEAAAYSLAKKLTAKNLSVDVLIPNTEGWDWNDVLRSRRQLDPGAPLPD